MTPRLLPLLASALLLGAGPVLAQEPPPATAAVRQAVEIPLILDGVHILVDGVRVNGQGPYRFLLDTGAQGPGRADAALVTELGLPRAGSVGASDGGGGAVRELPLHRVDLLELGPLRFESLDLVSRDYNSGGGRPGAIAGVLGIDLFHGVLLTIDYGRSVLRIEPGSLPEADGLTVFALDPDRPIPTVDVTLAGRTLAFHIDTGSMGGITVGQAFADGLAFTGPLAVVGQARTVSGAFEVKQGVVEGDFVLGSIRLPGPTVSVMPHFQRGNLGGDFLRAYAITLDMANRRVRLVPAAGGGAPAPRRYGFMMAPPRPGQAELELAAVAPGSPAETAGLRAGDRITALNGTRVADLGESLPRLMRESPLVVTYVRDGETRDITLTLD